MPDSGWWKELTQTRLSTLILIWFAICATAGMTLLRPNWVPEPFSNAHKWIVLAAICLSSVTVPWMIWTAMRKALALRAPTWWTAWRLGRLFPRLTEAQRNMLISIYKSGKDSFEIPDVLAPMRWFVELSTLGFIEAHSYHVWVAGQGLPYSLTPAASKAMRSLERAEAKTA